MNVISRWTLWGLLPLALAIDAPAVATTDGPRGETRSAHRYEVAVADDLSSVVVRAEFADPVDALAARTGDGARLTFLEGCDEPAPRVRGDRVSSSQGIGCVRYRYPLAAQTGRRSPAVADGVVLSEPAEWLWLPRSASSQPVEIELSLPAALAASVPWQPLGGTRYRLPESPGSSTGAAVFGAFAEVPLGIGGTTLRVALVDGPGLRLDRGKTLAWLEAAARDVAGVAGGFPSPAAQVIVQPVRVPADRARSAVPFGWVIRDGGESVRFFVDPDRPLADYLGDWTATHEFSHLLLPYVRSREKWISEGFASYYQNVLLARRGVYSEREAWQRLHRSFTRAGEVHDPPALSDLDERPFWEVRMLIYWSGAAVALMADAKLREVSGGRESLDTVLARLRECCLPSGHTWRGDTLFAKLDALSPHPVFVDLYREYADAAGMPDLDALYADLGLEIRGDDVVLRDGARLATIRRSIMGG